jgi:hypothetical protein
MVLISPIDIKKTTVAATNEQKLNSRRQGGIYKVA